MASPLKTMLLAIPALLMIFKSNWSAFPFDGYVPEGGVGLHDPAILDFDGQYFCFHTGPGLGMFSSSSDLMHWKPEGAIIPETPEWLREAVSHNSVWAPEAKRTGKGLRLYYSASARFGHNDSWIGVAECANFDPKRPKSGWKDLGQIISSKDGIDNFNAIDPDVLTDPSGREWMYFGSYWSGLYVCEIDPGTGKLKDSSESGRTLIAKNPSDKANGLEAPCCIYRDGWYFLFVNYGLAAQGVNSTYRIVVGRSRSPKGPFLDSKNRTMVEGGHEDVLYSSSPMFGPGGGVEFQDSKGRWLMSLHYYDARKFWHNHVWGVPTLQVRGLHWSEDGWPLPGLPVTEETVMFEKSENWNPTGKWVQQSDFGRIQDLEIKADGTCLLGGEEQGTYTLSGKQMEFHWPNADSPGDYWVDRVELTSGGHYFVGRNQARMVIRAVRAAKD